MYRKAIVYPRFSRAMRSFGLSRNVLLELLMQVHEGIPRGYELSRNHRMEDARYYKHRITIMDEGGEHLFLVVVDDTTLPDHLVVTGIGHGVL